MMKTVTRFSFLLCIIFLSSCQIYQKLPEKFNETGKVLSGKEIHSVFSGKTWEGQGSRNLIRTYFAEDGFFIRVANRKGYFDDFQRKLVGKWWVENHKLCIRFDKRQPNCGYCHFGLGPVQNKLEKDFCQMIISDGKGGFVNEGYQKMLIDNPYKR